MQNTDMLKYMIIAICAVFAVIIVAYIIEVNSVALYTSKDHSPTCAQ